MRKYILQNLTRKMRSENSRHDLMLKIYLNMPVGKYQILKSIDIIRHAHKKLVVGKLTGVEGGF